MKVLIDTLILLWALSDPPRLTESQRGILTDPTNSILVSGMSIAEIAIKASTGKLAIDPFLKADHYKAFLQGISDSGFEVMPYRAEDAVLLGELEFHHRDPFDRMIITQALRLDCPILTMDSAFDDYPVRVVRG